MKRRKLRMNDQLIKDFVDKVDELKEIKGVKEIPEDATDTLKFFSPSVYVMSLDVTVLRTVPVDGLQEIVDQYYINLDVIHKYIYDITHFGKPDKFEKELDEVRSNIINHSKEFGLATSFDNLSKDATVLTMLYDLKFYLEAVTNYIGETFDVYPDTIKLDEVINNNMMESLNNMTTSTEESTSTDDDELDDVRFREMLTNELIGATDGEPFTDEELYGEEKPENE